MGLPPPPRRFHGLEVFRCPACQDPKALIHSHGLGPRSGSFAGPALDPKVRGAPPGVRLPLQRLGCFGSAVPGFASPGTFRPRSFSLPRRFTPRTPCFSRGKPRDPLPLLGFRAGAVATRPARRRVLPHSAFRPRLAVPSASHPPALRNRRSRALDTTRPVEPYFRRKRPKACAPVGSFQPASIQGGRADSGARTEVCASPFRSVPVATRPKPRGSVDCFRTPSPA